MDFAGLRIMMSSPHTRGWSGGDQARAVAGDVVPAHAGVVRLTASSPARRRQALRVRFLPAAFPYARWLLVDDDAGDQKAGCLAAMSRWPGQDPISGIPE